MESVYENALYIVLTGYRLCVERQKDISVFFRGKVIGDFKADLIVNEKVIVELKAVRTLGAVDFQIILAENRHFLSD
ncbi:MAG: GxxExxY protein [Deltaproteobacteria bacterium]|nr:GxxExxY protein [Deltaproteobacteria bacterium]